VFVGWESVITDVETAVDVKEVVISGGVVVKLFVTKIVVVDLTVEIRVVVLRPTSVLRGPYTVPQISPFEGPWALSGRPLRARSCGIAITWPIARVRKKRIGVTTDFMIP